MLKHTLLFFALLWVFSSASNAQTGQWPLTPEQIFDSNIKIEYTSSIANDNKWSDELRILSVNGELFRYTSNFTRVFAVEDFDGISLIDTNLFGEQHGFQTLAFDHQSRTVQPFESPCMPANSLEASASGIAENPWTIVIQDDEPMLCHLVTGDIVATLPQNYNWIIDRFGREPSPIISRSPDKRYVSIMGEIQTDSLPPSHRLIEIYAYDTQTNNLYSLGQFEAEYSLGFGIWAGTQVTIYSGETCSICSESTYIVDVSVPDSLELAYSHQLNNYPVFFEDPPRYVFGAGNPYTEVACGYAIYDINTRTMKEYELGGCRPEFGTLEGVGYYRDVPMQSMAGYDCCALLPEKVPTVPVTRFDAQTGESRDIYEGEVEQILWVSSDERYAVLLLDNSGVVDNAPYVMQVSQLPYRFLHVALIDLETGGKLVDTETTQDDKLVNIVPISDREFIMIECRNGACPHPDLYDATRLTINKDGEVEYQKLLDSFVMGMTPDRSGILYRTIAEVERASPFSRSTATSISIYDITTGTRFVLVNGIDSTAYRTTAVTLDSNTLLIDVEPRFDSILYNRQALFASGDYRVHFSDDGKPVVKINYEFPALGQDTCLLYTAQTALNARVLPGADQERFGGIERFQLLLADGQATNPTDNRTWFHLANGGWIQSGLALQSEGCTKLPTIDPNTPPARIPQLRAPLVTCTATTLTGVNLRSGTGVEFEQIGSAAAETELILDGFQISSSDNQRWWRLTTGEWVREDFVQEDVACNQVAPVGADDLGAEVSDSTQITCSMTTISGVNLRGGPGTEYERTGSAGENTSLRAVGKAVSTSDLLLWWQLDDGSWIRLDYVEESPNCESLPVVEPPTPPQN